jgi:hypothetical protein
LSLAAQKAFAATGMADKELRSRPLPVLFGTFFLCAVHLVGNVAAAVKAGSPKGRPMQSPDVRPGVLAAVMHEFWLLLHGYNKVAPCAFSEDFKPPQRDRFGHSIRPKAPPGSHLRRLREGELLYFNEMLKERFKAISADDAKLTTQLEANVTLSAKRQATEAASHQAASGKAAIDAEAAELAAQLEAKESGLAAERWYSTEVWFEEEEDERSLARSFFGVPPSSLHHLLVAPKTLVKSPEGKRAQSSTFSAKHVANMLSTNLNASETLRQLHGGDASKSTPIATV